MQVGAVQMLRIHYESLPASRRTLRFQQKDLKMPENPKASHSIPISSSTQLVKEDVVGIRMPRIHRESSKDAKHPEESQLVRPKMVSEFILPGFAPMTFGRVGVSIFTGFYWVLPGFTGFYWVLPGFTGFYWVLPGLTRFYEVLRGFTGFYRVSLVITRLYRVLPGFTGFYWVLPGLPWMWLQSIKNCCCWCN